MHITQVFLIAALGAAFSGCSHSTDAGNDGAGVQYVERPSPVLSQKVTKKGGASVSFLLGAAWGNPCGSFSRAEVAIDGSVVSVRVIGREPKDADCAQVVSGFTAPVTIDLPMHGKYRFLFWQSDTSAIDTTFVIK